jgi:hypothetical protein
VTGKYAMDESINVENEKQAHQKPPRNIIRIACEILAGAVMGFAVSYAAAYVIGSSVPEGCFSGFVALGYMLYIVPPLYTCATAVGVYLVGRTGNQTGSMLATLGGVFLGVPVIALLYLYIDMAGDMMLTIEKIVLWPLVFLAAPGMATLCFNLTRRYKKSVLPRNSGGK